MSGINTLAMLGCPISHVIEIIGEPFGQYYLKGRNIYMFTHGNETIACETEGDTVVRANTIDERRTTPRIKPSRIKKAFLRHGSSRQEALVLDLSAKGVAMQLGADGCLPAQGEFVTFCTSLKKLPTAKTYIVLSGHVHKVFEDIRKVVIFLYTPYETHSYKMLTDYLNLHQAMNAIKRPQGSLDEDDKGIEIVKSDLCLICDEGACGFSYAAMKDKVLPLHRGVYVP